MTRTVTETGSAQQILQLGNAFCQAQVLLTAAELDLFTALRDGPASADDIRTRLGLNGRGLRDFLRLLVLLGLLEEENGRYRNSSGAQRHLVAGRPGYVGGFLRGAKTNLYPVWDGLTETLRTGQPRTPADSFAAMLNDPEQLQRYAGMMDGVLQPLIPRLLDVLDWSDYRSVLDIGGCRGALVGQLVTAHPELTGHVFDLPQMRPLFQKHMADLGTTARVRFHAGDFFQDPLPSADVLVFGHVLHNWQPQQREQLMRKAFQAVYPGGVVLVHDRMLDESCPRLDNLLASLIMALVTEEGAEYSVSELTELAQSVGFTSIIRRQLDDNETVVLCHKAA